MRPQPVDRRHFRGVVVRLDRTSRCQCLSSRVACVFAFCWALVKRFVRCVAICQRATTVSGVGLDIPSDQQPTGDSSTNQHPTVRCCRQLAGSPVAHRDHVTTRLSRRAPAHFRCIARHREAEATHRSKEPQAHLCSPPSKCGQTCASRRATTEPTGLRNGARQHSPQAGCPSRDA